MATSSITKTFVIDSDKKAERFLEITAKKPHKSHVKTNFYGEGKKTLKQFFGR